MPQPERNSMRWRGCNYAAAGWYYVTICIHDRHCWLGRVVRDAVQLTAPGAVVRRLWLRVPAVFPSVTLAEFVVMPNHMHALVHLADRPRRRRQNPSLGQVIGWWKGQTTTAYALGVTHRGWPRFRKRLWQRGYFDRVLRDEDERSHARAYILRNPRQWAEDPHNPKRREHE
jgi:putative transposase